MGKTPSTFILDCCCTLRDKAEAASKQAASGDRLHAFLHPSITTLPRETTLHASPCASTMAS
jgi:hypothetical protein